MTRRAMPDTVKNMMGTVKLSLGLALVFASAGLAGVIEDGRDLESRGRLAEARTLYEAHLKSSPEDHAVAVRLIHVLIDANELPAAEKAVTDGLARAPEDAPLLNELGRLRFTQGRYPEAVSAFRASGDRDPKFPDAAYNLGVALLQAGKEDEARDAYRRALDLNPRFIKALNGLAVLSVRHKDYPEALRLLGEAEKADSADFETQYNMGSVFLETEKSREAVDHFRRAIELRKDNGEIRNNYGRALIGLGRNREAEEQLKEAVRLSPKLAEPHLNLGILCENEKRFAEAEAEFMKAHEMDPRLAEAAFRLGSVQLGHAQAAERSGNAKTANEAIVRARNYFQKAVDANADYTEARYNLTLTLLQTRSLDAAGSNARELVKRSPGAAQNHFLLGTIEVQRGRIAGAEKSYKEALRLDPKCLDCLIRLGSLNFQTGKLPAAAASYREAIKLDDKNEDAHYMLGQAMFRQGEMNKAKAEMLRVIELNPGHLDAINSVANIAIRQKDSKLAVDMVGRAVEKNPAYLPIFRTAESVYAQTSNIELVGSPKTIGILTGYVMGVRLFFKDYKKARSAFSSVVETEPKCAAAHMKIGILDILNGKNREGLESLKRAENLAPNDTEIYYAIGTAYYNLGDRDSRGERSPYWNQSYANYRKAAAAAPINAEAFWGMGSALYMMGKYKDARRELGQCLKLNPFFAEAYNTLGSVATREADLTKDPSQKKPLLDEGIQMFRQALRANPNSDTAHYNLGIVYHQTAKYEEAITEYETALRLNPKFEMARYKLARVYVDRHGFFDRGKAEDNFQKLMQIAPDNCEFRYDFGAFYFNSRKYDKAKAEWRTVLQKCPDYKPARDGIDRLIERGY